MAKPVLGVIGGSGLYEIDGLADARRQKVETPFGAPSDELLTGTLDGQEVVFLPRHGRGHRIPPTAINFRANICALKMLGVTEILSMTAVGSLREELHPGSFVIVDQFIDRTFAREKTFFGPGLVVHVSCAYPVCTRLGDLIEATLCQLSVPCHRGGTYLVMEGPQFSTAAESNLYRAWGCDVIGMTNMPEAKLAREAEMCYATVAMVTDYDAWHPVEEAVTVDQVLKVMAANSAAARALVKNLAPRIKGRTGPCPKGCQTALDGAVITPPAARDPRMVERVRPIAGRVL